MPEQSGRYITALLLLAVSILLPHHVQAVTVTISNTPSSITDQPFSVNVSIAGASTGTNYLRANLFPPNTTNYFGYTFNGASYVNSSDYSQYYPINIDSSGSWSGTIQAKNDSSSGYYTGAGNYSLKIRRYTSSGSSYTWSNELTLTITEPTPTPSPSPTTQPAPTPTPTPTTQFTISNIPSSINSDQSFIVDTILNLPANPNSDYYLKGAFLKDGSSNYFGLTQVSSLWVKNSSTYTSQQKITTDSSGSWSGKLSVQPDISDSGFTGTGQYTFKVGRYTSAGSGPTWSNDLTTNIKNISSIQTPTPTPTPTTLVSNLATKNPEQGQSISSSIDIQRLNEQILGTSTSSPTPTPTQEKILIKNSKGLNIILLLGGTITLLIAIFNFYRYFRNQSL